MPAMRGTVQWRCWVLAIVHWFTPLRCTYSLDTVAHRTVGTKHGFTGFGLCIAVPALGGMQVEWQD